MMMSDLRQSTLKNVQEKKQFKTILNMEVVIWLRQKSTKDFF